MATLVAVIAIGGFVVVATGTLVLAVALWTVVKEVRRLRKQVEELSKDAGEFYGVILDRIEAIEVVTNFHFPDELEVIHKRQQREAAKKED